MRIRLRSLVLPLVAAGCAVRALAAGAPPIAVQQRVLVMPKLPAGAHTPANLPEEGAVKMPFVTGGAPGVASLINAAVWREMLDGTVPPVAPGNTFTPRPDKLPAGTVSLDYTASLLPPADPRLLSLQISAEGCGAYCEEFTSTRIFDLRDGRRLSLGDLLTLDGFAGVGHRVDNERRRAYQQQVRTLKAAIRATPKPDKDDDTADRLALNQDCLAQVASEPSAAQWLLGDDLALDGRGGLVMTIGRCSNHAMRALDDVDRIRVVVPAADLEPWLTPYGLAVVRHEGDAPPPPSRFDQRELHGRLNGLSITMKLDPLRDGAETRGWYSYDKYHVPIALTVSNAGDEIDAVEQTATQGRFELTPAGGSLAGTWADKGRGKRLPVLLQ
jgi:hypothetical protein